MLFGLAFGTMLYWCGGVVIGAVYGVFLLLVVLQFAPVLRAGPHQYFCLEDDVISWSKDLKRFPLTVVRLSEVVEVEVRVCSESSFDHIELMERSGALHFVEFTGTIPSGKIVPRLRKLCPRATFWCSAKSGWPWDSVVELSYRTQRNRQPIIFPVCPNWPSRYFMNLAPREPAWQSREKDT